MIIGRGDIAKAIKDKDKFLFYANGFSNRIPFNTKQVEKEWTELLKWIYECENNMFVYISTLSIYYSNSEYTKWKLRMEDCIKRNFNNYCILRIGNITWGDNPNTLLNHLRKDTSRIDDTFRYLIDQDELNHWIDLIPRSGKHDMNITGKRMKVSEIVEQLQKECGNL